MFRKCFLHTFFLFLLISSNSLLGQSGNNPFNIVPGKKAPVDTPAPEKKVIPEVPAVITPVKEEEPTNEVKEEVIESKPVIIPELEEIATPEKVVPSPKEDQIIKPVESETPKSSTTSTFSNNPFDIKVGSRKNKVISKKKNPQAAIEVKEKPTIKPEIPKAELHKTIEQQLPLTKGDEKNVEEKPKTLDNEKLESENTVLTTIKDLIKTKEDKKGIEERLQLDQTDAVWNDRYMLYGILLFIMVALTLIINMNRRFISKIYKAAGNENVAKLSFREYQSGSNLQYYLSYILFIINMSIFVYLLLTSLGGQKNLINLFLSFAAILAVYLIRHGVLTYMGMIFPLKKEVSFYSFNIFLYNILYGMVLIPINMILILGPQSINKSMLVTGCLIFFIFFIFRQLRGLSIGRSYLKTNQFHFFTYLCSVEIAPILILIKYLMS